MYPTTEQDRTLLHLHANGLDEQPSYGDIMPDRIGMLDELWQDEPVKLDMPPGPARDGLLGLLITAGYQVRVTPGGWEYR